MGLASRGSGERAELPPPQDTSPDTGPSGCGLPGFSPHFSGLTGGNDCVLEAAQHILYSGLGHLCPPSSYIVQVVEGSGSLSHRPQMP